MKISKRRNTIAALLILVFLLGSWSDTDPTKKAKKIEASQQRSGDPQKGKDYLLNGNYLNSGIPFDIYNSFNANKPQKLIDRTGDNENVPPQFNTVRAENNTKVIAPNCLTCHSEYINGKFIIGLGNNTFDYTQNLASITPFVSMAIVNKYGIDSPEWHAFEPFKVASEKINPELQTEVRGVNPADKLTSALVAHRDPVTLEWSDEPLLAIPDQTIPTDVPPWWVLKKKNAMFYTAIGRGDFSKFLMASSLLTLKDSTQAAEIDKSFPDVLSWINTLEAPAYPFVVDQTLAQRGQRIFELNCSKCHGNYSGKEDYPNLLIPLDVIGTDPALSDAYTKGTYSTFINWYNKSWFTKGAHPGKLVIEEGYVAQPLDGIWATAPYLHNGSVPTLDVLLNSKSRPEYWQRSFNSMDYDSISVGWKYKTLSTKEDVQTYDTNLEGYGNKGHEFGDDLSDQERRAVIEYLKTI